jgi:hypothetical protein
MSLINDRRNDVFFIIPGKYLHFVPELSQSSYKRLGHQWHHNCSELLSLNNGKISKNIVWHSFGHIANIRHASLSAI